MPVVVLVRYQALPGRHDTALQEITSLVRAASGETGCLGISVLRSIDDDGAILLYERWSDKGTYFGPHMQTAYIRAFIERARQFLAGPPDISVWHETLERG